MQGAQLMYNFNLTYKFYTKPWPRIYGLCGKKQAGGQAAHTQSEASPFEMSTVNKKRCTGRQCSPVLQLPTGQSLQLAR